MPNIDTMRDEIVSSFYDNSVMLNTTMNIEQLLADDVILYPYKNWENAEIVGGPFIRRYFVNIIFRFSYKEMPDPDSIPVLKKFGINVRYKKVREEVYEDDDEDYIDDDGNAKIKKDYVWYVQLEIPKKLVTDEHQADILSSLENILDIEAIESVADETDNGDNQFDEFDNDNFGSDDFSDIRDNDPDLGNIEEPDDE